MNMASTSQAPTDHDRLFKELLTTFLFEFLQLFSPKLAALIDPASITSLDKEIFTDIASGEWHDADRIAGANFKDGEQTYFLIHLESQAKFEKDFPERMYGYFARLFVTFRKPIYPIAVFSYSKPTTVGDNRWKLGFPDAFVVDFRFKTVQLNQLSWRKFLRNPNPVAAALPAKMKIAGQDRPRVKLGFARMMSKLQVDAARRALLTHFSDACLSLTKEELAVYNQQLGKISPPEREKVMRYSNSWEENGRSEGLLVDRSEGRLDGRRQIVRQLLRRRLGPGADDLWDAVSLMSEDRLLKLANAAIDFRTTEDARNWFTSQR